jgi:uncharacterized membrane protein YphA (DoxX/SURF4 family)
MQFHYPLISWNPFNRFLIRFGFVFVFVTLFPFPIDQLLPFFTWPTEMVTAFYNFLIPIIGKNMLGIKEAIDLEMNGSGDKTMNYIGLFIQFMFGLIGAIVWSILSRKQKTYNLFLYWFLTLCRYYLAFTMFGYGFSKVFHLQMGPLSLNRLVQPIGEQSPMGMAWNFIGFSDLYCAFSGWAEVIAGVLLLFTRTTVIGAICTFVVMFNVMLMNYGYDIPVKIYSGFLVLLSLIILTPYYKRLLGVFFSNHFVNTLETEPVFRKPWQHRTALVIKYGIIFYVLFTTVYQNKEMSNQYGENAPKPPLYGIYETKTCIKNRDTIYAYGDTTAWKRMIFNWPEYANVLKYNDKKKGFQCKVDTLQKKIVFTDSEDSTTVHHFTYKPLNDTMYQFDGILVKDTFTFISKRKTRINFTLYKRGFHWVNEFPYNR